MGISRNSIIKPTIICCFFEIVFFYLYPFFITFICNMHAVICSSYKHISAIIQISSPFNGSHSHSFRQLTFIQNSTLDKLGLQSRKCFLQEVFSSEESIFPNFFMYIHSFQEQDTREKQNFCQRMSDRHGLLLFCSVHIPACSINHVSCPGSQ